MKRQSAKYSSGRRTAGTWMIVLAVAALPAYRGIAQETTLKKASYMPHWVPQAQFAGYYVAFEKGFYADNGIELQILRGGPEQPSSVWLEEKKADFATLFLSTAIEKRAQGVPLVNIAQMVQRSALLLVAKKDSGIKSPADFDGKTVTLWPEFSLQPKALFRKFGVKPRILPQRNTMNLFLRGGASVASAMWYNEYHLLLNTGLNEDELTFFHYDDYGLSFPEDGIYVLEETYRNDPEMCKGFVRATIKGWQYAFAHPEEALDIVMSYVKAASMPTTRIHHQWMLGVMKQIMLPEGDRTRMGYLSETAYTNVTHELKSAGIVATPPEYGVFYEDCAP